MDYLSLDSFRGIGFNEQIGLQISNLQNGDLDCSLISEQYLDETYSSSDSGTAKDSYEWRTHARLTLDGRMAFIVDSRGNLDMWDLASGWLLREQTIGYVPEVRWRAL